MLILYFHIRVLYQQNYIYFLEKIKKRYAQLGGTLIRAHVQRDGNNSMGLALAGHRDRNQMGSFVAGVNPKGRANSQDIKIGDEILEVNLITFF